MNYLHYDLQLGQNDVVVVRLDKQANVQLMDSSNYENYRRGERFSYYGGLFTVLVVVAVVSWVAAIILGGLWIKSYRSKRSIIRVIKKRLPPPGTRLGG